MDKITINYAIDTDAAKDDLYNPYSLFTESEGTLTFPSSRGASRTVTFTSKNPYHQAIYQAILVGLTSRWFFFEIDASTKQGYIKSTINLITWMNDDRHRNERNRYSFFSDFETYERNDRNLRHSNSHRIKSMINQTSKFKELAPSDSLYIESLLRLSKPTYRTQYEPNTLTDWFAIPWLRQVIGDEKYLQLESPRRLILSLRVVVGATLQYLLDMRKDWLTRAPLKMDLPKTAWHMQWNFALIKSIGQFDETGRPADELTRFAIMDCVNPNLENALFDRIKNKGLLGMGKTTSLEGETARLWRQPHFFLPSEMGAVSRAEERLAAWLAACEAIPPSDVQELKTTNYTFEYSVAKKKRLKVMQSQYHKGRSGKYARPDLLLGKHCWTVAMHDYLQQIPSGHMFKADVKYPPAISTDKGSNSFFGFLCRLWNIEEVSTRIYQELKRHNASALFMEALLALLQGSQSLSALKIHSPMSREEYEKSTERPVPDSLFTLGQIKTSTVHAGSDKYRDSDLVNGHSHTSLTEKTSYLTDDNKDYVNRFQRITRVVFNDLLNVVFRPSIDHVRRDVCDRELRTRITVATGNDDGGIIHVNYETPNQKLSDREILVIDCVDTAIYFIHYLAQAEIYCEELSKVNPTFVERTLLPTVEWMQRTLLRMSSTKLATKKYQKLKSVLPSEFAHMLGMSR